MINCERKHATKNTLCTHDSKNSKEIYLERFYLMYKPKFELWSYPHPLLLFLSLFHHKKIFYRKKWFIPKWKTKWKSVTV